MGGLLPSDRAKLRIEVMRDEIKSYRDFVRDVDQMTERRFQLVWLIVAAGLTYGLVGDEPLVIVLLPFPLLYLITAGTWAWSTVEVRWAYLRKLELELGQILGTPSLAAGVELGKIIGGLRSFHFTTVFLSFSTIALTIVSVVTTLRTYGGWWLALDLLALAVFAPLAALGIVEQRRLSREANEFANRAWERATAGDEPN